VVGFKSLAKYWLPVVCWMALIFSGSSDVLSARNTSRFVEPLLRWLLPGAPEATIQRLHGAIRKGGHLTEYGILAALVWRARRQPRRGESRPWRWADAGFALAFAALYAAGDELHQSFVSTRTASIIDVLWDSAGALLGLALAWVWQRWRNR
jgi:VanZ family protein